jgi:hypothetical protein
MVQSTGRMVLRYTAPSGGHAVTPEGHAMTPKGHAKTYTSKGKDNMVKKGGKGREYKGNFRVKSAQV